MARGTLPPAPRQRRGGAPGPEARAVDRRQPEDRGARGRAVPPAAGGRGEGDDALRDAAGASAADRLRRAARAGGRRDAARAPVRGDAGLLAADLRRGVRAPAAVVVVRGPGGRVPAFRRRDRRGPGGQPEAAGGAPRSGDPGGGVQRALPGVRGALGVPAAGVRPVPGADQGQGRERRPLRQAQRDRRAPVRQPVGAGGAPGVVDAGDRRRAPARHHGGGAAGTLRARRGEAARAVRREAAVRAAAGSDPDGVGGLRGGGGHQRLLGAVAADRPALLRPLDEYAAVAGGSF